MNTRVLCNWQPSEQSREKIADEFYVVLEGHGWAGNATPLVRGPKQQRRMLHEFKSRRGSAHFPFRYHQEPEELGSAFAVWSNIHPTQVRFLDGSHLSAKDGDVLLIFNAECEHRAPKSVRGRWFAAAIDLKKLAVT